MTRALHGFVRRWWAGEAGVAGAAVSALTLPAEWAFAYAVRRRNAAYDRTGGSRVPGLAVVSVGNLTVGGTGKTPVAAWIIRRLADRSRAAALVARGYGADELELHRRWNPDVPVVAHPDRTVAARTAQEEGAEIVVLDDGFQHRRLYRDVDMVLLAAEDPFPGRMLPRGPYREPPQALSRAHIVAVTRRTATAEDARRLAEAIGARWSVPTAVLALVPGAWQTLGGDEAQPPSGPVLAAAAVARPDRFRKNVAAVTQAEVELIAFPDHHEFTPSDVEVLRRRAEGRTLVVTEKDAVKLQAHTGVLDGARVLTQTLTWELGEDVLEEMLADLVGRTG